MKNSKFSVLLSLYDNEKPANLMECLLSLQNQTFPASEVVIIYDGVINKKLEQVVDFFKNKLPIVIIKIEKNVGLGKALNHGLKFCKYELIARMDTDDICLPTRFEKQIKYLSENPHVNILGSNIVEFDNTTKEKRDKNLPGKLDDIIKFSLMKNPINHMSVMFYKKDIFDIGGYKHHLYMEDYNLWLRAIKNRLVIENIQEQLLLVRVDSDMLNRRRGLPYIKSEFLLFKLKMELSLFKKTEIITSFFIRVLMRIIPVSLLSIVYKFSRK
ncbi:glycosyltransferase [Rosenbergiella australiborealis]|uniref:glycosyltransferase n=1 Tax=Rosenbergiella australiborealis TaxID=1544696 RepID=UPI001F4EB16E|nr:glycosyltransferase [Rosenbergiella australiborealis]